MHPSTEIRTGSPIWDSFVPVISEFLSHDKSNFIIDGRPVSGYRSPDTNPIWLRDHTHQMKGFKYFEPDMTSALDVFRDYQMEDGSFYDFFVHSKRTYGESREAPKLGDRFEFDERNSVAFARCGVEADVEYLAVESVYRAWQATGQDEWMMGMLDALESGLNYSLTDPARWSEEYGLVKRPFTIDTWDFEYGGFSMVDGRKVHESQLRGDHLWCIMHGDNTGMAKSCRLLARMFDYTCQPDRAAKWRERADYLARRTNEVCWNGRFYTHQVHITPVEVEVDESQQLSLSNAYNLNRGVPDHQQCCSIIEEYMRRRERTRHTVMAEWFSIDPPFPGLPFGHNFPPGDYVNGGIMPLVGGELARGAFENGFEDYGVDILRRYHELAIEPRETYLWYRPDGSHHSGGSFLPTDGWGSAAMLCALMEGLAGVEDASRLYETVHVSPRWAAAGERTASVTAAYESSGAHFTYDYEMGDGAIDLKMSGTSLRASVHLLLPKGTGTAAVTVGGSGVDSSLTRVRESTYVDFECAAPAEVRVRTG